MVNPDFSPLNLSPPPTSHTPITHPTLGPLTGTLRSPSVVQFRSIPYARIPARFRQSVPISTLEPEERDCTEYGPACPQNLQSMDALGGMLEGEKAVWFDEGRCLGLTVTVPRAVLEGKGKGKGGKGVPVMVHVHGGAFIEGSHTLGVRDTARMVELSVKESMPVIIVAIHYRINWQGFLACQDLVDEAATLNEPASNFGLYDQRAAFQWIQKHISGFGGDAQDITAFGESAGSISLAYHMCSTVPLFQKVVLQSGTASSSSPVELSTRNEQYFKLLDFCGIDRQDEARLEKLRNVPVEKLVAGVQGIGVTSCFPTDDRDFFPVCPGYFNEPELFEKCDWVKEIIIAESLYEGYIFAESLRHVEPNAFVTFFEESFGSEAAGKILSTCSITRTMDRNLFWTRLNTLAGDLYFSAPTHHFITTLASLPGAKSKKIYRYNNALRNPFPGSPYYGVAGHHFIEVGYQFMTLLERYPHPRLADISIEFARRLIGFANGKAPWDEFEAKEQRIAVVSSRGWETYTRAEDEEVGSQVEEGGRRYRVWETLNQVVEVHRELKLGNIFAFLRQL